MELLRFHVALMHGQLAMSFLATAWKHKHRMRYFEGKIREQIEDGELTSNPRYWGTVENERTGEIRALSGAVIMFQASMEAIISMAYTDFDILGDKPYKFKNRWATAFERAGIHPPHKNFDTYYDDIYKGLRNRLVHLGKGDDGRSDVEAISQIDFDTTYKGIRAGWWAYAELYEALGNPHTHTWEELCKTFGVPKDV